MKTSISILCTAALLPLLNITAPAQENPAPAAPSAPAARQWLAATDAQWQAVFKRDVTDPYDAECGKVKVLYLNFLDDAITKASKAGDLDGALALRNEQKRFGDTQVIPDQDEAGDAAAVKRFRPPFRAQIGKANLDKVAHAKIVHAKYDQVLAIGQTQLTKQGRLDDAMAVKNRRDAVAAAWVPTNTAKAVAVAGEPAAQPAVAAPGEGDAPEHEEKGRNLFKNSNFEHGTDDWEFAGFSKKGKMMIDRNALHDGKPSLRIDNAESEHSFVRQTVVGKPHTRYRFTGYIKTKNAEPATKGGKQGVVLLIGFTTPITGTKNTPPIQKTNPWRKVSFDFATLDKGEFPAGASLGMYNGPMTGTAWFSELSVVELGRNAQN